MQKSLLPLTVASILRAIEDRGVAVEQNRLAFQWGRRAAHDFAATRQAADIVEGAAPLAERPLDVMIAALSAELRAYADAAYAKRFLAQVSEVAAAEQRVDPTSDRLTRAHALGLYKLMAVKDEYEVARLFTEPVFMDRLRETFSGDFGVKFHFAPPIAGAKRKIRLGSWALPALRVLAALRFLRGSWFDPFRHGIDRKLERAWLRDYETLMSVVAERLTSANLDIAVELAALPQRVRGFGPVKARYAAQARRRMAALLKRFDEASDAAEEKRMAHARIEAT